MGSAYRLLTVALLALVTIIAFENMAISTAMPAVAKDLDAGRSYGLAFSFMLTAMLLGIVLAGVWADLRGPLPSLFAGQLLMAAGSAMAGLAPTFSVLLAGRLLAGLGSGLIVVALYVVIGRAYPDALRPKVFSWVSAAWVLPSLVGPPVAGWVTSTWSWRWVFLLVIVPIAMTFAIVNTQRDGITGGSTADKAVPPDGAATALPVDHVRLALLGLGVAISAGAMQWGSTQLAAAHGATDVTVLLGGRLKHMTPAMNEVLADSFSHVRASLAHQKSRLLIASGPRPEVRSGGATTYPLREHHLDLDMWVCAHGAAFAGTKIDIGTRFLLEFLDRMDPAARNGVDLGCGTGVIATALTRARPQLSVLATDESAAAVSSALATIAANGLTERVRVLRDDAMSTLADASVDLVVCNPPFHLGTSVHAGASAKLFQGAGRVLKPGGQLWTVFNSHLPYPNQLTRAVGRTRIVGHNSKFTVAVSTRRSESCGSSQRTNSRPD